MISRNNVNMSVTALNNYMSTLVDPISNAIIKKLWSYIKSQKQDDTGDVRSSQPPRTITDPIAKINVLVDHFSSAFPNTL